MTATAEPAVAAGPAPGRGRRRAGIDGFAAFGGAHCETASLRKALGHQGAVLSEAMLLGLGGGIGFIHLRLPGMPRPFVGGRNGAYPEFALRIGAALGLRLDVARSDDPDGAHELLMAELVAQRPAICYGDIRHLPYFHASRSFGGHAFVVYEVDERQGLAWVSDRGERPRTVSLPVLARARCSPCQLFPPRGGLLRVRGHAPSEPSPAAVRDAIAACRRALDGRGAADAGTAGMVPFGERLDRVTRAAGAEEALDERCGAYIDLELAGTGGAAFRVLYRDFLREAAGLLGGQAATEAAAVADDVVGAWRQAIDALLPPLGPGSRALRATWWAREHVFLHGTADEARRSGGHRGALEAARREAIGELRASRADLPSLAALMARVRDAERRLVEVLAHA